MSEPLKSFMKWPAGPTLFYLLSAACLLIGATMVIVPIYANPTLVMQKLYLVGTLNLYEWMLLLVAFLVCKWKSGNDDAVSLTFLVGVFLVCSSIGLDTISIEFLSATVILGIAGILMAGAKLFVLHRYVTGPIQTKVVYPIMLILLPNFVMPAVMSYCVKLRMQDPELMSIWGIGWCVTILGAIAMIGVVMQIPAGESGRGDKEKPFLHGSIVKWIFAGIIIAASFVHQYTISYMCDFRLDTTDLLPAFGVFMIWLVELQRSYGKKFGFSDFALLLWPLVYACYIIGSKNYRMTWESGFALISYPPAFMGFMALMTSILAWKKKSASFARISGFYLFMSVLFFGVKPNLPVDINWEILVYALVYGVPLAFFGMALVYRNPNWAVPGILIFLSHFSLSHYSNPVFDQVKVARGDAWFLGLGFFILILYLIWGRKLNRFLAFLGSVSFTAGLLLSCFCYCSPFYYPMVALLINGVFVGLIALRTKDPFVLIPVAAPLALVGIRILPQNKGWLMVLASFFLLAIGAYASFVKTKNVGNPEGVAEKQNQEKLPNADGSKGMESPINFNEPQKNLG